MIQIQSQDDTVVSVAGNDADVTSMLGLHTSKDGLRPYRNV